MNERVQLLLSTADDELIVGWRDSEWTGIAPTLEEDVAFSSIAQNEIGHARALYEVAAHEQYGRRGESVALWVVPRGSILEVEDFVDELNKNYHRVDGYSLKAKLKEARERAGTAGSAGDR